MCSSASCRTLRRLSPLLVLSSLALTAHAADWPQFGFDAAHSGNNSVERNIGAANVSQLVAGFASPAFLGDVVDGAPVYASGVATAGGVRNLLFAFGTNAWYDGGSSTGTMFAIDAATGALVWSQVTTGSSQHASASPAIDPSKQYVYSFGLDGYVHKYQIGDGTEILTPGPAGWPVQVTLKPDLEKVAGSLTIAHSGETDYLEVVLNGYGGDVGDYQGHLVSIDLTTGARKVFNGLCSNVAMLFATASCGSVGGGIWGRGGATFDATAQRIYISTGNGRFNASSGGADWGDSVLALAPDGSGSGIGVPLDSYTPTEYQQLQNLDLDLGSTSLALLPVPAGSTVARLGLQVGKDAILRLIDLDNMSGAAAPGHAGGEVQQLPLPYGYAILSEQPAVWVDPADGSTWIFVGNRYVGQMSGLQLGLDGNNRPALTMRWTVADSPSSMVIANNVLYHAGTSSCSGLATACKIVARNPTTGDVLWTSSAIGAVKWSSPIVIDGAIYITDQFSQLWKFALPDNLFDDGFDGASTP